MWDEVRKVKLFIVRDFRILRTYKLAFSMSFLGVVFNLFYFVLFGSMFGSADLPILAGYGGGYVSYLIVGSIGWGFLWSIMGTTSSSLRSEMMMGTFESILLTKTRLITILVSYALYGSFFGLLSVAIFLGIGAGLFNVSVFATATPFTLLMFVLSAFMMLGVGMTFGGLTIWLKNIGATATVLQSVTMFFCGVYFPLAVLPEALHPVSQYIPFYYSIEGLRRSLLPSSTASDLSFYAAMVGLFSIAFIALGWFVIRTGMRKAKRDGSLSHY